VDSCPHEILELAVRHWRAVDQKSFDRDAMNRRFLRIMPVRSHAERAAGNEAHVVMPLAPIAKRWKNLSNTHENLSKKPNCCAEIASEAISISAGYWRVGSLLPFADSVSRSGVHSPCERLLPDAAANSPDARQPSPTETVSGW
jgi:hypothetical protein